MIHLYRFFSLNDIACRTHRINGTWARYLFHSDQEKQGRDRYPLIFLFSLEWIRSRELCTVRSLFLSIVDLVLTLYGTSGVRYLEGNFIPCPPQTSPTIRTIPMRWRNMRPAATRDLIEHRYVKSLVSSRFKEPVHEAIITKPPRIPYRPPE